MSNPTSEFLKILEQRGFIHQCTDAEGLDERLRAGRVTAYVGFDCTAPSLHVGSLIQIMALRWLQKTGNKPVIVLGGATTRVGDPSGKDEARKLLTDEEIARNAESIGALFGRFLHTGTGAHDALIVNNAEWLDGLRYIDMLREVGRHFPVSRMLSQESVRLRLEREQNLSFLEFNYMVLQAYDFVELHRRFGVNLQIGGSDQWGNIVMGIELQRRMGAEQGLRPHASLPPGARVVEVQPMIRSSGYEPAHYTPEAFAKHLPSAPAAHLFGLTTPLLATASGAKMGKTATGAVWLSADMVSAYEYWQFWRNTDDADVGRFLRLFTELPLPEIERLEALEGAELNEAKKTLATEATRIAHGDRAAKTAAQTARKVFEEGGTGETMPEVMVEAAALGKGLPAYEIFRLSGLASSGSDAKRLIRGGGAKINGNKVTDEHALIGPGAFNTGPLKLTAGKKRYVLIKLE
ncbi:MAG: tyrosine--tRNA ligase [Alphaproteobacteria bacterium]|nr:tyrosine--tRNA ligase [Alphaproteobacteria bacterium]